MRWSFVDPEVLTQRATGARRIRGELDVRFEHGTPDQVARCLGAEVQLAAAHRYKQQIDADWLPGEPFARRVWTAEEAWQALLTYLGGYGANVQVENGEIRVLDGTETTIYRIDPDAWAVYLSDPDVTEATGDADVVPAATPLTQLPPLVGGR